MHCMREGQGQHNVKQWQLFVEIYIEQAESLTSSRARNSFAYRFPTAQIFQSLPISMLPGPHLHLSERLPAHCRRKTCAKAVTPQSFCSNKNDYLGFLSHPDVRRAVSTVGYSLPHSRTPQPFAYSRARCTVALLSPSSAALLHMQQDVSLALIHAMCSSD
jgi:hypothetical protein